MDDLEKINLGPIHEVHVFDDGSFMETFSAPGISISGVSVESGEPVQVVQPDSTMKRQLLKGDRHLYYYDTDKNKILKKRNPSK